MFKGKYHQSMSHSLMLSDEFRTTSYHQAIKNKITKGDVVVDFGAGTGILSLLCAHYGAKKVYAVEINKQVIKLLKKNIKDNNLEDKIEVCNYSAHNFIKRNKDLKVDLVVSECLGDHLFESRMLYDMLDFVKQNNVKKQIPESFELLCYGNFVTSKGIKNNNLPVVIDTGQSILKNNFLDNAYFMNNSDKHCPYFTFTPTTIEYSLFKFSKIDDLILDNENYISNTITFNSVPSVNNYAMLYFNVMLDKDCFFTNHPKRKQTNHSYYQRLVNLSNIKSNTVKFSINVIYDTQKIEDIPFPNIKISSK